MIMEYEAHGDGPPVVFVHGAAEDAELLRGQAEALADHGLRAIHYSRRGTGGSPRTDWPQTTPEAATAQHADDLAQLLRATDACGATVIGFSSGGVLALAFAARHPGLSTEV